MKRIIWKAYWNYEKEEKWLNEMAAKGLALHSTSWCRYVFEDTAPGEYTYRIELLPNMPGNAESQNYIRFMEDSGVELVATYLRWAYFRRKASAGAFDLYSDRPSRIRHYRLVRALWLALLLLEGWATGINLATGMARFAAGEPFFNANTLLALPVAAFFVLALCLVLRYSLKIGRLKREQNVME